MYVWYMYLTDCGCDMYIWLIVWYAWLYANLVYIYYNCMYVWYMYLTGYACNMYIYLIVCVCDMCLIMMHECLFDMYLQLDVSMWNMYINGMYNYVVWVIMVCMLTWYMYKWWIVCVCVASVYESSVCVLIIGCM